MFASKNLGGDKNEKEDWIIACGPIVPEVIRAPGILKRDSDQRGSRRRMIF
jgi:hypothetical protein